MSYPQPTASQEVLEGQEIYRLNTLLDSSGDAYELNVSAKAFAIGPESDVARARVTYFDPINGAQSFIVSVGCPWIGRIDALENENYPVGAVPGNIIVTPEDIVETKATIISSQSAFLTNFSTISYIKPRLDLIAYLSEPRILPLKRADARYNGPLTITDVSDGSFSGDPNTSAILLPYYRRKYASIKLAWGSTGTAVAAVYGLKFRIAGTSGQALEMHEQIIANTNLTSAAELSLETRASTMGTWDYLMVTYRSPSSCYNAGSSTPTTITAYDIEVCDEEN